MTNERILQIALEQSAIDCNCTVEDLVGGKNVTTLFRPHPRARKYLNYPIECQLVSYGKNVVAVACENTRDALDKYINENQPYCFSTPNVFELDKMMRELGVRVLYEKYFFLPDLDLVKILPCRYETKVLYHNDFEELYLPQWGNALCEDRRELDVLGVGAYHNGELIGLAGCSADGEDMYQIGVDVLPQYRRQGIASALTSRLTAEILKLEKVPFYCCAWSNIGSARNAIKCGFRPTWVEIVSEKIDK